MPAFRRFLSWLFVVVMVVVMVAKVGPMHAATSVGNRLTYLEDAIDPYYVHGDFPKLITPQWVGQPGVRAVVILAIDDMRDPAHYENYLRPILTRLARYQTRPMLSIMTNQVDPQHPQLQSWLQEGVSIDIHTIDHPCPLLHDGDFAKAKSTYERCIDLMCQIPGNRPVAFRMPCCDSMNSPSPRFYQEIFPRSTPAGNFLAIDSSIFNVITTNDLSLPRQVTHDNEGESRFDKYVQFSSFVNTIRDYPYPYTIGKVCWEFPCVVPSDWEAQHLQQPFNPKTVEDMKAALDAVVAKQGTYNLVFHPHGWIRNDQVVELIDHAERLYENQVLFLNFREALDRLNEHLLAGVPLRPTRLPKNDAESQEGRRTEASEPSGLHQQETESGNRLLDINHDGYIDVIRFDRSQPDASLLTRLWNPQTHEWISFTQSVPADSIHFGIVQPDAAASFLAIRGAERTWWHFREGKWVTERLVVDQIELPENWRGPWRDSTMAITYRLRDLDADGRCEILCDDGQSSLVLTHHADGRWKPVHHGLPSLVRLARADGGDAGLRWVDLNGDLVPECLWSDPARAAVFRYDTETHQWHTISDASRSESHLRLMPSFVRADGTNQGVWFHSKHLWVQNEDTANLPDKVDRLPFEDILQPKAMPAEEADSAQVLDSFPEPLEPEAALAEFRSSLDIRVELAAAEPLVVDPVAMDWGPDGRCYVAEMRDYPTLNEGQTPRGRIKVLTDDDGDGRYDRADVFLDEIAFPNGVKFWRNGVLVTSVPDVFYAEDTDGDSRADRRSVLFTGFGAGNPQHRVNGLVWGVDGWLYLANGDSGGEIRSTKTDQVVSLGGRDLRIRPDTGQLEAVAGQTQFGRVRDDEGNWFGCNNSEPLWHFVIEDRYLARNPHFAAPSVRRLIPEQPGPAPIFPASRTLPRYNDFDRANRFTSVCGPAIVRDSGMAPDSSLEMFVCEPVHNLIHRETMVVHEASFRSRRADVDQAAEFLASRDNWFRPVQIRSGPDGALWVADIYRLIIEHPEWIPASEQARVDLRAGEDRGRIYRLEPRHATRPAIIEPLTGLTTKELAQRLDHSIRWQRDMAHQMLLWQDDRAAIGDLQQIARSAQRPVARMHALSILDQWQALDDATLAQAMDPREPVVARHAIALAEPRLATHPELLTASLRGVDSLDASLRLQLACSLGAVGDGAAEGSVRQAADALAELALSGSANEDIQTAVLTSLNSANLPLVLDAAGRSSQLVRQREWITELVRQAVSQSDSVVHQRALALLSARPELPQQWQWSALDECLETYRSRHDSLEHLPSDQSLGIRDQMQVALRTSQDENAEENLRIAAIRLLRRDLSDDGQLQETLIALLQPRHPPAVIEQATATLVREYAQQAIEPLLTAWPSFSPHHQQAILDRWLERRDWTTAWLQAAIDRNLSLPLDARRRQQLLHNPHEQVRSLAERMFVTDLTTSRETVVSDYLKNVRTDGDVTEGRKLFERTCAVCHELAGMGHAVGPALAALENRSTEQLLIAILDPNRALEATYREYLAETVDGRSTSGILLEDTSVSKTLLGPESKRTHILRHEIERFTASDRSLMPEGLERDLTAQQMSHLLAFLQSQNDQPKSFPGNRPELVPRRDDGSMRLLAMHAEIFGPSLVYEEPHTNLGFWASSQDYAAWTIECPTAGTYRVTLDYACDESVSGNRFAVVCRDQQLTGEVSGTGNWSNYRWQRLGSLELPAGRSRVILRAAGPVQGYLMDLHMILLERE